jgi:predicted membrane chloride channel (bestrophin family)
LLPTTVLRPSTDPLGALDDPAAGAYRRVAMIHYPKRYWGLPLAFRWFGSPFPRTIPFVALSVGLTTALQLAGEWKRTIVDAFGHPYPFQVYAFVIGFLVVLRTNHALARFMEARGAVEQMQSKWADAALMLQAFDGVAGGDKKKTDGSDAFIARIVHLLSLLHALALQQLRGDEDMRNLVVARQRRGNGVDLAPAISLSDANADVAADVVAVATGENSDASIERGERHSENDETTKVVRVVLTGEAFAKHRSRSTYNLGGAFHQTAAVADAHQNRANLLSAFSLTEADDAWRACCAATPLAVVGGVDGAELAALRRLDCDRAYLVMSWIQAHIVARAEDAEGLRVPPPVLSRVYQTLSEGMLGFNQADKLAKTPFPMPYAQMLTVLLLVFNVTLPVMIAGNVNALWLALVMNVVSVVAYQGLNETARELEDPFKPTHANDLGLPQLQAMFNSKVRAATPGASALIDQMEQMKAVRSVERRE